MPKMVTDRRSSLVVVLLLVVVVATINTKGTPFTIINSCPILLTVARLWFQQKQQFDWFIDFIFFFIFWCIQRPALCLKSTKQVWYSSIKHLVEVTSVILAGWIEPVCVCAVDLNWVVRKMVAIFNTTTIHIESIVPIIIVVHDHDEHDDDQTWINLEWI